MEFFEIFEIWGDVRTSNSKVLCLDILQVRASTSERLYGLRIPPQLESNVVEKVSNSYANSKNGQRFRNEDKLAG